MPTVLATPEEIVVERRPYRPYGAALKLMMDRASEILLSGPAGTGKTRANLEKIHLCAEKYPGMRGLFVRKTRASLSESVLVTFEEIVLPEGHECLNGPARTHRQSYRYQNGSVLVCGGMDKATRTLSTEYDMVYVAEAIELTEDDWEMLIRPLRHGKMPYQQLIADTNPDRPSHWLKRRCDTGRTKLIESRHEDNPTIWDASTRQWTNTGGQYIAKLDALTGPRKQRLRYGRWVQAEGVVYDGWDAAIHVLDRFDIPDSWERYLAIDFGFNDPFVCQWWAKDNDGRLYLYREYYRSHVLVEDAAREIKSLSANEPAPRAAVCDHDAEGRATFERHSGFSTIAAHKKIREGIQEVAGRLKIENDGKARLFVLRDSLLSRDPLLSEKGLPLGFAQEIDGYVWDTSNNRKHGEEPVDKDNHSMDAARYMAMHLAHKKRICVFI